MSKQFSAQRERAFLDYLAASGNQTLSAERANVSRSWVGLHRASDAGFDAARRGGERRGSGQARWAGSGGAGSASLDCARDERE